MDAGEGDAGHRRLPAGADRISALPDELIQGILAWLPSTGAAARTSALSRRWRRVWTNVPALTFHVEQQRPLGPNSSTPAAVDAALQAYSATAATLSRLDIDVHDASSSASRAAPWLTFASMRLAGELRLSLSGGAAACRQQQAMGVQMFVVHPIQIISNRPPPPHLDLPICERATRIDLARINCELRLPSAGAFAALRVLRIHEAKLVQGDVGRLVSTQCPRLVQLEMCDVSLSVASLAITSKSLERLVLRRVKLGMNGPINVAAPRMYCLTLDGCGDRSAAVTIATTMLADLTWNHAYEPNRHKLDGADRQIYRLVATYGSNVGLFKRFDLVDELCLHLSIPLKTQEYKKFLQDMDELPKTNILEVKGLSTKRHLETTMSHLLGKHTRLTKIKVDLFVKTPKECSPDCNCVTSESWTTDDVDMDSLEEVEISSFTGHLDDIELLKLLFRCKIKIRRLVIHTMPGISLSQEMQKYIWGLVRPHCINLEFETTQFSR
ncbi:hypothetical protein HU200_051542 [Digitaria exilis]|uniref:F-box domain-containing protein n=1 Tax=Digitaria exilis TaxID=1010633 RepID=A0A835E9D0_9POAL|nr:hypothetical protein HU200_051542 [Digitaria exilis]CAB3454595.1 unnamed protein product [Digitaria exilis]